MNASKFIFFRKITAACSAMEFKWKIYVLFIFTEFIQGCPIGFYGNNCTSPCRYPSFGTGCQGFCPCSKEFCDNISGCRVNQDCDEGYSGSLCTIPCKYPWYGNNCKQECKCIILHCNHISGCHSTTDMYEMTTNETKDDVNIFDEYKTVVIIGSCSITIPIIVFLSVVLRKYRSHKKRHEKRDHHKSSYMSNRPNDLVESKTYDTIEVEESYDPDLYINTRNDLD